MSGLKMSSY